MEEIKEELLDLFHFGARSREPEEGIIRITNVPQSPIVGIVGISRWELLGQALQRVSLLVLPVLPGFGDLPCVSSIGGIGLPVLPLRKAREEFRFDEMVKFVQVDIAQKR